jgi:hypothetical protein
MRPHRLTGRPRRPSRHRPLCSGSPAHSRSNAFSPPPKDREQPASSVPELDWSGIHELAFLSVL